MSDLREKVMNAIEKGGVGMRSRRYFLVISALIVSGVLAVLVALLYVVSLAMYFLHENGSWYAPAFGGRGWIVLLHSAPILLLVLVAFLALLLEILVRKYSFAYRAPLMLSLGGILCIIFAGGFAIAQTSLHHLLEHEARRGRLPAPMGMWYDKPFRISHPDDMRRGIIVLQSEDGFVIVDPDGDGTSTVKFTPKTRFPYGEDFQKGDMVIVIGDSVGTGTLRAFGVREITGE